jgi:hypothetical protein
MLPGCEVARSSSATPIQNQDSRGAGVHCALYKSVAERRKFNGPLGQFPVNGAFRIIECRISQLLLYLVCKSGGVQSEEQFRQGRCFDVSEL